jgi:hypothetical protein
MNHFADLVDVHRLAASDQPSQRLGNCVLALARGQLQDLYIFLVGDVFRMRRAEDVISHAKLSRGKHLFAVPVIGKRARLTQERIDHVPIIDRHPLLAE